MLSFILVGASIPIREVRWEALNVVYRSFSENKISGCFISSGVLLGLYRDGELLTNDDDIDFTCPYQMQDRLSTVLDYPAWKTTRRYIKNKQTKFSLEKLGLTNYSGLMDIYFYNTTQNGILFDLSECNFWINSTVLPVKLMIFKGRSLPVPNDPDKYLSDYYGGDWKITKPGWKGGWNRPVPLKTYNPWTESCDSSFTV